MTGSDLIKILYEIHDVQSLGSVIKIRTMGLPAECRNDHAEDGECYCDCDLCTHCLE